MSPFLLEFLRSPLTVAAVTPSGPALSRAATVPVPRDGDPVVVELGPGTGTFTDLIQRRLGGRGRHLAIELNERFAAALAQRHPEVDVVVDDAANLAGLLAARGLGRADVIVSGLPWSALSGTNLMARIAGVLAAHGTFTTFAYTGLRWSPPARRLRRSLEENFDEVLLGRTVWANMPPALVYYCRRPAGADGHVSPASL